MSWPIASIESIAAPIKYACVGGPFGSKLTGKDYVSEGIPVIRGANMGERFISNDDFVFVTDSKVNKDLSSNLAFPGDVVFTQRGTLGQVSLVPENAKFDRYVVSQSQMKLTVDESKADAKYIYYYFSSKETVKKILNYVSTSGVPHINLTVLRNFGIPLPKLAQQQEIARTLSTYDDLIENNKRRIELLEESARQLYKEWFVRFRFPGYEHVKIIDGVPEGWSFKPLKDIASLTMGQSPKSEFYNSNGDGLPFHQGVTKFGFRYVEHETYCTKPTRLSKPGDILFSVRAPVGRMNITNDVIVLGRGLSAIHSKDGFQSFLFYVLKSYFFKEDMIGGGAIYASVTKKDMESQELLIPTEALLNEFNDFGSDVDKQIFNLHQMNVNLTKARGILLPKLMSGEIAV